MRVAEEALLPPFPFLRICLFWKKRGVDPNEGSPA